MKSRFLFPYYFKFIGLFIALAHIPIVLLWHYDISQHDTGLFTTGYLFFISTILLMTVGLLIMAFSKEKTEDEQIAQLRLDSLHWAIYLNYTLLIICLVFTRRWASSDLLKVNLWVPIAFFIIRFRWKIYLLNRSLKNETL